MYPCFLMIGRAERFRISGSFRRAFPLYLEQIHSPSDIKAYTAEQRRALAEEMRAALIERTSHIGGHIGPNLGVIEATIALHTVFDAPTDKIIYDVSHQCYPHKMLTGRAAAYLDPTHYGEVSGFTNTEESPYDHFNIGHTSTSISLATGLAKARDLAGRSENVVAFIGDGALSGGEALEGLNVAGEMRSNLIIILNDNDMSIDRAVGGMEKYLLNIDTNETYNRLRFKAAQWLHAKGWLDDDRKKGILRLNNALKSALSHQQNIFEGMNIRYFGPFDGHDVKEVVRKLRQLKLMRGPKLLHLHTTKGKGYKPAEESATIWHAPGKFDPATGERLVCNNTGEPPRYQDVFGETLVELAQANPKIVGVTPAMPTGCSLNIMMKAMPNRAFDVGIAEGHAVTFSAGMAKDGLMPFCNIYSSFSQRAYDNIIHDAALLNLPVVLCLDRAGLVGEDGPTHHGVFDIAALRAVPNLTIASPMDEHELRNLMYTAQLPNKGTFVIRYPRGNGVCPDWRSPFEEITVGTGRCLRAGTDVAVITLGPIGNDVAKLLDEMQGTKQVAHYDLRFVKPLDENLLQDIGRKFNKIITIEDGVRNGGMGSAVLEWMSDHGFRPQIVRMGLPDAFVEHGSVAELRQLVGLDADSIRKEIEA